MRALLRRSQLHPHDWSLDWATLNAMTCHAKIWEILLYLYGRMAAGAPQGLG